MPRLLTRRIRVHRCGCRFASSAHQMRRRPMSQSDGVKLNRCVEDFMNVACFPMRVQLRARQHGAGVRVVSRRVHRRHGDGRLSDAAMHDAHQGLARPHVPEVCERFVNVRSNRFNVAIDTRSTSRVNATLSQFARPTSRLASVNFKLFCSLCIYAILPTRFVGYDARTMRQRRLCKVLHSW